MNVKTIPPVAVAFAVGLAVGLVLPRPGRPDADPAAKLTIEAQPDYDGLLTTSPTAARDLTLPPARRPLSLVRLRAGDRDVTRRAPARTDPPIVAVRLRVNGVPVTATYEVAEK